MAALEAGIGPYLERVSASTARVEANGVSGWLIGDSSREGTLEVWFPAQGQALGWDANQNSASQTVRANLLRETGCGAILVIDSGRASHKRTSQERAGVMKGRFDVLGPKFGEFIASIIDPSKDVKEQFREQRREIPSFESVRPVGYSLGTLPCLAVAAYGSKHYRLDGCISIEAPNMEFDSLRGLANAFNTHGYDIVKHQGPLMDAVKEFNSPAYQGLFGRKILIRGIANFVIDAMSPAGLVGEIGMVRGSGSRFIELLRAAANNTHVVEAISAGSAMSRILLGPHPAVSGFVVEGPSVLGHALSDSVPRLVATAEHARQLIKAA